jgi:chromosome segregation ATPase
MARYDMNALKKIGTQCKSRLPPANAVQAMFLYEMQRQAEVQALFQGQMFELARVKDTAKSHEPRIEDLEEQMKEVQMKANRKDVDERLATSKVRIDALAARLNEHFIRLGEYGRRLTDVETAQTVTTEAKEQENVKLNSFANDIQTIKSDLETAHTATKEEQQKENAKLADLLNSVTEDLKTVKAALESADKEIGILFEERDALFGHLKEAEAGIAELKKSNERINKLEHLVRALTLQKSSPPTSAGGSRSPSVHFCPITTKNGDSVDLVVPKGKGFVSLGKEDIKAFVPGKSWGA